jgi:hypothetical protein
MKKHDMNELDGRLGWIYDSDDIPDGAWFAMMEDEAQNFLDEKKSKDCNNTLVHTYLEWKGKQK